MLAKPAPQTPLIAAKAVALLHQAGVPEDALILLPGGPEVGARLVADPGIAGVAFTGSTQTAWAINRALAAKDGPIVPLIAETGGQNAMLVDSSALPEQVVADVLVLVPLGRPALLGAARAVPAGRHRAARAGDAGRRHAGARGRRSRAARDRRRPGDRRGGAATPRAARGAHAREGRLIQRVPLRAELARGCFFAPQAFEIDAHRPLEGEVFGPILHVVRFAGDRLEAMIDAINGTGYGLTLGVHSRIDQTVDLVLERARAGNIYVNRNMIGAVVGVQPFGGEGLSGTGPKAGGPHYLARFATERTVSVNTAAVGGNASLLSLEDDPGWISSGGGNTLSSDQHRNGPAGASGEGPAHLRRRQWLSSTIAGRLAPPLNTSACAISDQRVTGACRGGVGRASLRNRNTLAAWQMGLRRMHRMHARGRLEPTWVAPGSVRPPAPDPRVERHAEISDTLVSRSRGERGRARAASPAW